MGGCCTNSTTLRLISNNGFHISEHGLAILFDIWNKLYYTRHIKYNWMDHLTGICFKNSHSSAFAGLSSRASSESHVSPASLPLAVSRLLPTLNWTFCNGGNKAVFLLLLFAGSRHARQQQSSETLWPFSPGTGPSPAWMGFGLISDFRLWVPRDICILGVAVSQGSLLCWVYCNLDREEKEKKKAGGAHP